MELPYAPAIPWFVLARKAGTLVLEQHEHYQKGSYRNRCHIAGPQRLHRLSIPLQKGKHQRTAIRSVQLSYAQAWTQQHWQALQSAYGRSPFFEFYSPTLSGLYTSPATTLWDFNLQLLQWIYRQLQWPVDWFFSTAYGEWTSPVIDAREWVHPKRPLPAHLQWQPLAYWQVFQDTAGSLPDLSLFDLLFTMGPEASLILDQAAAQLPDLAP